MLQRIGHARIHRLKATTIVFPGMYVFGRAGPSAVAFDAGAIATSPSTARRRTAAVLEPPPEASSCKFGGCASQRRRGVYHTFDEELSTSSSTIVITHLGLGVNGRPSRIVEAGVTQIKVTSTSGGEVRSYTSTFISLGETGDRRQ